MTLADQNRDLRHALETCQAECERLQALLQTNTSDRDGNAGERLHLAIASADAGVWDWDISSGYVIFSERWETMLGYSPGTIRPHFDSWKDLLHPEDLPTTQVHIEDHLAGKTSLYQAEFRMKSFQGDWLWIQARGKVHFDAQGKPKRMLGTHTDITQSKKDEQALRQAKEEAERASMAKTAFLAVMSHELRTPLNGVLGMANELELSGLNPAQRNCLETIRSSGTALLEILDDILDYAQLESGHIELKSQPLDLALCLQELINKAASRAAGKGLKLSCQNLSASTEIIKGDPDRFRQILANLLDNAIKFTSTGVITLSVEPFADGKLRINVKDTGMGIPEEHKENLFQPFNQGDNSSTRRHGGTGLGLSISRRLARLMGGDIVVSSKLGKGSCFTLSLPVHESSSLTGTSSTAYQHDTDKAGPIPSAPPDTPKNTPSVLLAEDNLINQRVALLVLGRLGLKADVVNNGREALEACGTKSYDVVLMDLQMPEMDGIEATRRIRNLPGYSPVRPWIIALTAAMLEDDRNKALAAGMNDFLLKPFKPEQLRAALHPLSHS